MNLSLFSRHFNHKGSTILLTGNVPNKHTQTLLGYICQTRPIGGHKTPKRHIAIWVGISEGTPGTRALECFCARVLGDTATLSAIPMIIETRSPFKVGEIATKSSGNEMVGVLEAFFLELGDGSVA